MSDINIWAVVAVAASSFLLGGLWYSPLLFLNPWNKAMGRTDEQNGHPGRVFGLSFLFALVSAYVFAFLLDGGYHTLQFVVYGVVLGAWP